MDAARVYVTDGYYGPGWIGSGWYWAPGFGGYTFIPANGILYSPFGWGFYSPTVVYRAPLVYGGFGRGYYYGYNHPRFVALRPLVHGAPVVRTAPAFHGGPVSHAGFGHVGSFPHGGFGGGGRIMMNHR